MGKDKAQTEWRRFEIAVSRLEALLRPRGYVLKSPDRLLDGDTGQLREVDCSITDTTTGRVISLECRRRGKKQDVLWIEQLVCKKESLGLAGTIAVSSKGFSDSAQAKARKRGVALKTFSEILAPTFLVDDRDGVQVRHLRPRGTMRPLLTFGTDDDEPVLDADAQARVATTLETGDRAVLLRHAATGQEVTMHELVQACLSRLPNLPAGSFSKECRLEFPPKTVVLAPIDPLVHVRTVTFVLDIEVAVEPIWQPQLFRYEGGDHPALNVASAEMETIEFGLVRLEFVFIAREVAL
jgi:hypothetical protein